MGHGPDLSTIDGIRRWLGTLPPAERVRVARRLADTKTTRELAVIADATVAELFQAGTASQVAEELGITVAQVRRAVHQHRTRQREAAAAEISGTRRRAETPR